MKTKLMSVLLALLATLSVSACGDSSNMIFKPTEEDKKAVMTVDGREVEFQAYRYFYLNNKRDSYGSDTELTSDDINVLISLVEENVKEYTALNIMAEKYGAELTKEQHKDVDNYVKDFRSTFSDDEAYLIALEQSYLTDDLYRRLWGYTLLQDNILAKMKEQHVIKSDEASVDEILAGDDVICVKHIFINYTTAENKPIAESLAEKVLGRLMDRESFEELMKEYNLTSDSQMSQPEGSYIARYTSYDEIWNAATALAEGEYSCVVESPVGFHIIKRCEKNEEYMKTNRDEIFNAYARSELRREMYELIDSLTIEYTEHGKTIDHKALS